MQGIRQVSRGQVVQRPSPIIWQTAEMSAKASALKVAVQEVDLLPEFEEWLHDCVLEERHVPGREGLMG